MMNSKQLVVVGGGKRIAYLTFRVGQQWYAVDVGAVFEVSNMVAISKVPDMPPSIVGMVNIRGDVVAVIDLRLRFRVDEASITLTTPIIFLRDPNVGSYGIIVDDIDDVINLYEDAISQTTLTQKARHIKGLTDLNGRLIMLLHPVELLLSSLEGEDLDSVKGALS